MPLPHPQAPAARRYVIVGAGAVGVETVCGAVLWVAAGYVTPGEVAAPSAPAVGVAWLGAYPQGTHPLLDAVAGDLAASGWVTHVVPDIRRHKAAKLTSSVTFALSALYPPGPLRGRAERLVRDEARDILAASGHDLANLVAETAADRSRLAHQPTDGPQYGGNSTWQSLARARSVETDFINGEIVLATLPQLAAPAPGETAPAGPEALIGAVTRRTLLDGPEPG